MRRAGPNSQTAYDISDCLAVQATIFSGAAITGGVLQGTAGAGPAVGAGAGAGAGGTATATTITFGHGARHLAGSGLSQQAVELAISAHVIIPQRLPPDRRGMVGCK